MCPAIDAWEYHGPKIIDMEEHRTSQTLQTKFDTNAKDQRFLTYLKGYYHHGATQYSAVWIGGAPDGTCLLYTSPSPRD